MPFRSRTTAVAGIAALLIGQASTAHAENRHESPVLKAIAAASPAHGVEVPASGAERSNVELPGNSSGKVKVVGERGLVVAFGLPFAEKAMPAKGIGDALIAYDNANGSSTVPIPQADRLGRRAHRDNLRDCAFTLHL